MYKYVKLSLFMLMLVLFSYSVFSQEESSPKTAPLPGSIVQPQQIADVVHKVMSEQKKDTIEDINKHMDENFAQLDARIMSNNKILFRKAIFAILGGMTVVLIGYAYLVNRVSKKYDLNFYEKLIENKINSLNIKLPGHLYLESVYKPVTYTDERMSERFDSPKHYFDEISKKQEVSEDQFVKLKVEILNEVKKMIPYNRQVKPLPKGMRKGFRFNKKSFFYILIIVVTILTAGLYFYFKYFKTTTGGV